jgi:hypothetical protein
MKQEPIGVAQRHVRDAIFIVDSSLYVPMGQPIARNRRRVAQQKNPNHLMRSHRPTNDRKEHGGP